MISYLKNAVKTWSHAQVFLITLGEDASVNEGNCAWRGRQRERGEIAHVLLQSLSAWSNKGHMREPKTHRSDLVSCPGPIQNIQNQTRAFA